MSDLDLATRERFISVQGSRENYEVKRRIKLEIHPLFSFEEFVKTKSAQALGIPVLEMYKMKSDSILGTNYLEYLHKALEMYKCAKKVKTVYRLELEKRLAEHEKEEERKRTEERLRREELFRDKIRWIESFGSPHLKRAFGNGYNSERQYVTERAALEFPDYTLDFDCRKKWVERVFPSIEALDYLESAIEVCTSHALHAEADVKVVWLIEFSQDGSDPISEEVVSQKEAIVIQGYLDKYVLVRKMGDPLEGTTFGVS